MQLQGGKALVNLTPSSTLYNAVIFPCLLRQGTMLAEAILKFTNLLYGPSLLLSHTDFLPQPPQCWHYKHVPPHSAVQHQGIGFETVYLLASQHLLLLVPRPPRYLSSLSLSFLHQ